RLDPKHHETAAGSNLSGELNSLEEACLVGNDVVRRHDDYSASGSWRATLKAPTAIAGAVLRATGSRMMLPSPALHASRFSLTRKRWSALHRIVGGLNPASGRRRFKVAPSRLVSPALKRMNCFGYMARESGHKRVPEPPDKITG